VGNPSTKVIGVAAIAIEHGIPGRRAKMLDRSSEQRQPFVVLAHQHMSKPVGNYQSAHRADGIYKERMRSVERVDKSTAIGDLGPTHCLHGARTFQREFVEVALPRVGRYPPFVH
jgi:hypothetical protein